MEATPILRKRRRDAAAVLAAIVLAALPIERAVAVDLLGFYAGGALGQSTVEATAPIPAGDFSKNHSAFKLMAGVRPISLLGAELAYVDLGHPSGNLGGLATDVTIRGAAAFGLLYLPVPVVDIFAKAGLARLQSTFNASNPAPSPGTLFCTPAAPNCNVPSFRLDRTYTDIAFGGGAQFKLGSWALRAEYERFTAAGRNPGLLSVGVTYTFL
jgi:hypothetical protein